ncbi:MAG: hypothetical protein BWY76_02027 [bacterium ADurb.Bin429]|nr:MAG: hypothetical protein BWY76_02027 [bacterium ADurb.Bin429]
MLDTRDGLRVDHVPGRGQQWRVQRYDVGIRQQIVKGDVREIQHFGYQRIGFYIIRDDTHAETDGNANDMQPDTASADHAEGFFLQVKAFEVRQRKIPGNRTLIRFMNLSRE